MLYLSIFYWIFAALCCFGVVYKAAKDEIKLIVGVIVCCIIMGGILFPMYLGRSLNFNEYE